MRRRHIKSNHDDYIAHILLYFDLTYVNIFFYYITLLYNSHVLRPEAMG